MTSTANLDTTATNNQPSTSKQPIASALVGTTCMELALEGERLCKSGDFKNGVRFFEEAIKVGTNDDRNLSAIYSQLGNAYYYMGDYNKALEYHKLDVALVNSIGDELAEAKACGNLGNTFKMLDKFDEAAINCRRYLEISRKLNDELGEAKALYNLGNVYYTQGRRMIGSNQQEPGCLSNEIKACFLKAIEYYEKNLNVVTKLKDYTSMGRAYGNLGNTHYLLENFEASVENHTKRLELARRTNDTCAERRAHVNLGNANVFLGNYLEAIKNYSATLEIAQTINDKYSAKNIADSYYSLANCYTFLRDYRKAIDYHLKYIDMLKGMEEDKIGEGRACWSLVNIYLMVNDTEAAYNYAKKHRAIAEQLGDKASLTAAQLNIEQLEQMRAQKQAAQLACSSSQQQNNQPVVNEKKYNSDVIRLTPDKRQEQEQRRFKKQLNSNLAPDIDGVTAARRRGRAGGPVRSNSNELLFDMIAHFQSGRIDDQRCEIQNNQITGFNYKAKTNIENNNNKENQESNHVDFESNSSTKTNGSRGSHPTITNPLNAVSSAIKNTYRKASLAAYPVTSTTTSSMQSQRRPTVSHEHRDQLFELIAGAQGQRMDEQRASLPALAFANGILKNPMNAGLLSRGHTLSGRNTDTLPETISENRQRDKSNSVVTTNSTSISTSNNKLNRHKKLTKHFETVDSETTPHDGKFLESLVKYQSNRFDDQRSEFPNDNKNRSKTGQTDDFFNLIVKFQSDRIDDQRSAPPSRNKE